MDITEEFDPEKEKHWRGLLNKCLNFRFLVIPFYMMYLHSSSEELYKYDCKIFNDLFHFRTDRFTLSEYICNYK